MNHIFCEANCLFLITIENALELQSVVETAKRVDLDN